MPHTALPTQRSALLSILESHHHARDLHCWSSAQSTFVEQSLLALFTSWRCDWEIPWTSSRLTATSEPLSDIQAHSEMAKAFFGPYQPANGLASDVPMARMGRSLADEAWSDWLTRIAEKIYGTPLSIDLVIEKNLPPPTSCSNAWDGSMECAIPWWGGCWVLRLDAGAVAHMLNEKNSPPPENPLVQPTTQPLIALTHAVGSEKLRFIVQLASISLKIGDIQDLLVGDLITLPHGVDNPASFLLIQPDRAVHDYICNAWLGQRNNLVAVELSVAPD